MAKESWAKIKRYPIEWQKIFAHQTLANISKIYKTLTKFNGKKFNNPIKNRERRLVEAFPKKA